MKVYNEAFEEQSFQKNEIRVLEFGRIIGLFQEKCIFMFNKTKKYVFLALSIAYFVSAMIIKHPFQFPSSINSTVIMKEYIFQNNQSNYFVFFFK
jgi:hypothetical protein